MAEQTGFEHLAESPADYRTQGEQLALGAAEPKPLERQGKFWLSWVQEAVVWFIEYGIGAASYVAVKFAEIVMRAEDRNELAFRELTRTAIKDLTGADPGAGHRAIGTTLLQSLAGGAGAQAGGQIEPSQAGAEAYMEIVMQLALEGYVEGGITSALSAGFLDKFTELDDMLAQVLGLGRMSRRVMQPLMSAKVITPFQWHVNKQYRPELLSPADAIRQFLRGRWTSEQMREELARQGWSEDRIEALVNAQRKFFGAADVRQLVTRQWWTEDRGLRHLQDQGYTQAEAEDLLRIEGLRRIESLEAAEASAIIGAYAAREIDDAEFHRFLSASVKNPVELALFTELGELRRALSRRQLSSTDARRLALKGVLSVVDFGRALEREGWDVEAVAALELELRADLADRRADEALRAEQAAAREAADAQRAAEKAARDAELAARQALPTLAEYKRAYVRGLIPRDAFAAAIAREKVAITPEDLTTLLADADLDRADYLEQLERHEAAKVKVPDAVISLEKYEQAVLEGILTLEQYARELVTRGFDESEQRLLTSLLADRLAQRKEADQAKAAAAERSAARAVSLADFERAVRLGVRTRAEYAAWLETIGTPEVARALILDVLDAQLRLDAEARARREAADQAVTPPALTLSQRRRAVVAGVRPRAYYEAALRDAGYATDDQLVELALLDLEIAERGSSDARRAQIAAEHEEKRLAAAAAAAEQAAAANQPPPAPTLSLAQLEKAVKLGLLGPDALRDELRAKGYRDTDAELLVAMTIAGVPDTRTAEQRWTQIAGELAAKGVNLADFERGVKAGFRSVDDYTALLAARGYGDDDQLLLRQLLEDEIALEQLKLRTAIEARLAKTEDAPTLAEIHDAVNAGELDAAQLRDVLTRFGVDPTTALLYARLVMTFGTEV